MSPITKWLLAGILAALAACAQLPTGLTMTPEDYASCAAEGCHTWTEGELAKFANINILAWEEWKKRHAGEEL